MSALALFRYAGILGVVSGLILALDGVVDLAAGDTVARGVGVLSPLCGILALTGIYLWVRERAPSVHLDLGYAANVVGLALFTSVGFTRSFALAELDDAALDTLVESGPTVPALIAAGVVAVIGVIAFGTALLRSGYDRRASLLYLVAVPVAGFGALMPAAISMVVQLVAGGAIVLLGLALLAAIKSSDARLAPA